jgi:hypothetical protein
MIRLPTNRPARHFDLHYYLSTQWTVCYDLLSKFTHVTFLHLYDPSRFFLVHLQFEADIVTQNMTPTIFKMLCEDMSNFALSKKVDILWHVTWVLPRSVLGLVGMAWTKCHSSAYITQRTLQHSVLYNLAHCKTCPRTVHAPVRAVWHDALYNMSMQCTTRQRTLQRGTLNIKPMCCTLYSFTIISTALGSTSNQCLYAHGESILGAGEG